MRRVFARLCMVPIFLALSACSEQVEQTKLPAGLVPDMAEVSVDAKSIALPYSFDTGQGKTNYTHIPHSSSMTISVNLLEKYIPDSIESFKSAKARLLKHIEIECTVFARQLESKCSIGKIYFPGQSIGRQDMISSGRLSANISYEIFQ